MNVPVGSGSASPLAVLGSNSIVSGLVAGLVGGVLGMIVAEVLKNPDSRSAASPGAMRVDTGIWVAIFGAVLGFTLQAWEGVTSGSTEKALRDGARGALVGAAAGFVGGYVAQWLYSSMLDDLDFDATEADVKNTILMARVIAWAIFGAIAGLGMGITGGKKKMINGLIGGVLGGAIGGFIFQQVDNSSTSDSGFMIRLIGLTLTGVGIGVGVGIVDRLRRDAWLTFIAGPMTGKEFILFKDETVVGADYRCDIVLAKDETVSVRHALFVKDQRGATTLRPEPGAQVLVNGSPVGDHRLRSGDSITLGRSTLSFQERAAPA